MGLSDSRASLKSEQKMSKIGDRNDVHSRSLGVVGSWRRWAHATEGLSVKERRSLSEVKERLLQAGKA